MLQTKYQLLLGSATILIAAASLAGQEQGNVQDTGNNMPMPITKLDRNVYAKNLADYEFGIRKQECETLKFDANGNAAMDCLHKAEQHRDGMLSKWGVGASKDSVQDGTADSTSMPSGDRMANKESGIEGSQQPSMMEKVKNTVKEKIYEITNDNSSQHANTAPQGQIGSNGGSVALLCQPMNNGQQQGTVR